MRTCLRCGGSAYSEFDPYCEHDFGDPPEPEFVKDLTAGYWYAEPYWLAASHPNDDGEWTYHAAHPTREGAIAAYEDGWRKGRFVHALFTRLTEWCREGEEAREGRERALPPRLIVRTDSYPEESKRVRLSGDCEAPDLRGLQGTMIKWDGRPAVSLDRPVFAAGAPYSIVTLDSPLKVVEVVEEETPLQLSVPPTTADTECQPEQPTFKKGDRVRHRDGGYPGFAAEDSHGTHVRVRWHGFMQAWLVPAEVLEHVE